MYKGFCLIAGCWLVQSVVMGASMSPPQVIHSDDENTYLPVESRRIQMVSSLAVAPGGRIWVTWYAGPTPHEDDNNYVVLATSGDDGVTWDEVFIVDPDGLGPVRAFDPEIWLDPKGRVWLFWAQAVKHGRQAHTWAMMTEHPDDEYAAWSEPFHVAPGVMMCKPIVLSDGEWLFPISNWEARMNRQADDVSAGAWISADQGKTFTLRGSALVPVRSRTFDEHMVVERKDGSLWMLVRTAYGIGESVSTDRGRTWTEVAPSSIPHPAARFFIHRLQSGSLLLVKHGSMEERTGRSHLTAFISDDDGITWRGGLLLDERGSISYPDGQQATDGTIYITYDYSRRRDRAIYMTTFTEADVRAGSDVSGKVRLQVAVSSPGMVLQEPTEPYAPGTYELNDNRTGVELDASDLTVLEPLDERVVDTLQVGALIWENRNYVFSVLPEALLGKRFVRSKIRDTRIEGRAERDGMVYVMARRGGARNRLMQAGFEQVNIPEFIPYAVDGAFVQSDAFSVFQKKVKKGDVVDAGEWGILIFAVE